MVATFFFRILGTHLGWLGAVAVKDAQNFDAAGVGNFITECISGAATMVIRTELSATDVGLDVVEYSFDRGANLDLGIFVFLFSLLKFSLSFFLLLLLELFLFAQGKYESWIYRHW